MSRGSELSQKKPEKPEKERVQGVKDSRGQVVKRQRVRGLEGWRVGRLATHLHFQTSNLLQKGIATHLTF